MADGISFESHVTNPQIHPLLRQRMLNRPATFSEGSQPLPALKRRRSSVYSEHSDTRHSARSSPDNLVRSSGNAMDTLPSTGEPSFWHSAPLAFAILPAVGGLLFQNGSSIVTDVLLLGLASMFLNWCVRTPWSWYYAAQRVQYIGADEVQLSDTILEEDESESIHENDRPSSLEPSTISAPAHTDAGSPATDKKDNAVPQTQAQQDSARELAKEEILALLACFAGPLLGAYLLHTIRSQLTRPTEGLVSNYNLTIFTMAAELRPVSHAIKLKQARIMHLQRIVRPETEDRIPKTGVQEILRRLADVEARLEEPMVTSDAETKKVSATVRQSLQPQLDALNRAVRRYEKRQAAQTIQMEARFGELESRLMDALALAAAAARTGRQPGFVMTIFTWFALVVAYGVQTSWATITYPLRTTMSIAVGVKSWFARVERQPRKRLKAQSNGHPLPTPRMQSRNGT